MLDDAIYLSGGRNCLVLHAATGERAREIVLPEPTAEGAGRWTNLRVLGNYLLGGCNNNLIPGDGLLNVPNLTGGCECNYTPTSITLVPSHALRSVGGKTKEQE